MIRVDIDTNILVSALLQPLGLPAQVFVLAISGSVQLCLSGEVYAEYEEVISRPRFQRDGETIAAPSASSLGWHAHRAASAFTRSHSVCRQRNRIAFPGKRTPLQNED